MGRKGQGTEPEHRGGFKKGDPNINRTGANRKSFSTFRKKCIEQGLKPVGKQEYYDVVALMMNMTEADMKALARDEEQPMILRWLVGDLSTGKARIKVMQDLRDWMFGKAQQSIDMTSGGRSFFEEVMKKHRGDG